MSGQIEFSVEGDQRKSHFPILFINFKSHVKTFSASTAVAAVAENASVLFKEEALRSKAKGQIYNIHQQGWCKRLKSGMHKSVKITSKADLM